MLISIIFKNFKQEEQKKMKKDFLKAKWKNMDTAKMLKNAKVQKETKERGIF